MGPNLQMKKEKEEKLRNNSCFNIFYIVAVNSRSLPHRNQVYPKEIAENGQIKLVLHIDTWFSEHQSVIRDEK